MAKSETVTSTPSTDVLPAFLEDMDGVPLSDLPDRDPILAEGRWLFQFVGFTVKNLEGKKGPFTLINVALDPHEAVDVDEPNPDYADLRQYHPVFIMRKGDLRRIKEIASAFGGDTDLPAFVRDPATGETTWPALEAAKGNLAEADCKWGTDRRDGSDRAQFSNFG